VVLVLVVAVSLQVDEPDDRGVLGLVECRPERVEDALVIDLGRVSRVAESGHPAPPPGGLAPSWVNVAVPHRPVGQLPVPTVADLANLALRRCYDGLLYGRPAVSAQAAVALLRLAHEIEHDAALTERDQARQAMQEWPHVWSSTRSKSRAARRRDSWRPERSRSAMGRCLSCSRSSQALVGLRLGAPGAYSGVSSPSPRRSSGPPHDELAHQGACPASVLPVRLIGFAGNGGVAVVGSSLAWTTLTVLGLA
jgi:hypothetical protein